MFDANSRNLLPLKGGSYWQDLPLHWRFAAAGGVIMLLCMLVIGWWVSRQIEESVTRNSAISTALYMDSFIAPLAQELNDQDTVSPETGARLLALFQEPHLAERIASFKMWRKDGLIIFSSEPDLIGKRFTPSEPLRRAWSGQLSAAFDDLNDLEDQAEKEKDLPFLEVYNPIHSIENGEVIAVAEFYQIATELEEDILNARLQSWLLVASVFLVTFAMLFGIVRRGSNLIERQRTALEHRYDQLSKVSELNDALRRRIQAASGRVSELNETFLKRISAELHDGPAQLLSFAKLRLDSLAKGARENGGPGASELPLITQSLDEALTEIRHLCRGLSLPAIECKPLTEVVASAVRAHEQRNDTLVHLDISGHDPGFDHSIKICAYRFVQEALNNAERHGGGSDLRVSCSIQEGLVTLGVSDDGPGFDPEMIGVCAGLGLRGLRERIESHGGSFSVSSAPGSGTRLQMSIRAREEALP